MEELQIPKTDCNQETTHPLVPQLVPPALQKTGLFPHPLWLVIMPWPGWGCPESPVQSCCTHLGDTFPPWLLFHSPPVSICCHRASQFIWFVYLLPRERSTLHKHLSFLSLPPPRAISAFQAQGMCHQAADCWRSHLTFHATTLILLFSPCKHLQVCS